MNKFLIHFGLPIGLAFVLTSCTAPVPLSEVQSAGQIAEQSGLLNKILERVPQNRGTDEKPQAFFIAAALSSAANVFGNETRLAQGIFDKRWNTANYSISLINDKSSVNKVPLASIPNLNTTIQPPNHRLEVTVPGVKGVGLTPLAVKNTLDRAKVKWRVVIVSACYSGGFIEALKDPNTLIMTASDANNTSFGCGHLDRYTYFGDAFYTNAFQGKPEIEDSFKRANASISALEKKCQFLTPSNPQLFIGD
jgi:Peptidase C13 family